MQRMVIFQELDTEIVDKNAYNEKHYDSKTERAFHSGSIEEPRTKKPCMSKQKDVTFYIPEIPEGLKALTNPSDGLRMRKESIVPGTLASSLGGKGFASMTEAWRQSLAPPQPSSTDKATLRKKHNEARLKRKVSQEMETEKVRRMFQALDTRELIPIPPVTKADKKTRIEHVNTLRRALSLRTLSILPAPEQLDSQQERKCITCKKLQKRCGVLELRARNTMKLESKLHELENRVSRIQEQNHWFQERNEWLESRWKLIEMQSAGHRSKLYALEQVDGRPSSSAPSASPVRRLAYLHRMARHVA